MKRKKLYIDLGGVNKGLGGSLCRSREKGSVAVLKGRYEKGADTVGNYLVVANSSSSALN